MPTSDACSHDRHRVSPSLLFLYLSSLRMTLSRGTLFFTFIAMIVVSGCVPSFSGPEVQQLDTAPKTICRVAVLPFINNTSYVQGDAIVYRIFMAELNRLGGFSVAQEGDIRRIFRQMRVSPKELPSYEQTLVLADRLGVDAIITGEIIAMHEAEGVQDTDPLLAVNLKLQAAGPNKPLMTTYHRRRGADYRKVMHFGLVNTMTSLAVTVSDEIIEIWFAKGLKPCVP